MLEIYKKKRDFSKTTEPIGKNIQKDGSLVYMIHKHAASRLHYDLRLELDGVLKSWAVPKGPSYDPEEKRLAVMVEDHPYDYKDFEGTIPKGEYGGGTVMIWDKGTYVPIYSTGDKVKDEKTIRDMIDKGRFSFILDGKKLRGEFTLIKLKKAKANEWILIKKHDATANSTISNDDESAYSQRSMKEIELGVDCVDDEDIFKGIDKKKLKKSEISGNVKPMLAKLVDKPFNKDDWIFEIKWDGYRTIAESKKGEVRIYSRNGISFNKKFKEITESLGYLKHDVVFDGEIVAFGDDLKPDFGLLQNYGTEKGGSLIYYVFDILHLDGYDLTGLELSERKRLLKRLIGWSDNIRYTDHVEKYGEDLFGAAKSNGLEGIIGKRSGSAYRQGERGDNWVKIKNTSTQEAIICGFTQPRGSRKGIGALILGVYEGGELIYIGHTGGGFDDKMLVSLKERLENLRNDICPFKKIPKTNEKPTWIEPELVCEVRFSEWTKDGLLRQPVFIGFREDKKPNDVGRETPEKEEMVIERIAEKSKVTISNPDKLYFPEKRLKKIDIADYYRNVSPYLLPYLKDRPESLKRYPDGIHGESFFQKNFEPGFLPDWINTVKVFSEGEDRTVNYMLANDPDSLLFMVNLGCIDLNPWSSRAESLDNPDYVILDFDPVDINFSEVIKAVNETHSLLEHLGIVSFCKTSGSRGMHILIPTNALYTYDQVTDFAKLINIYVNKRLPDITSLERKPSDRKNKVYLDYLQNRKGQTIASPYSLRARKEATVSTPLLWSEVSARISPLDYDIDNIFERLDSKGDVWEGFFDVGFDMGDALEKMDKLYKISD